MKIFKKILWIIEFALPFLKGILETLSKDKDKKPEKQD